MFAGVTLILRSPYLIGIALFIVGISAVSTLLYFEQLRIVEVTFSDSASQTRAFARIDWLVQAITVVSQVFLTGRIAARFGVTALLTAVPLIMVVGFLVLAGSSLFAVFVAVIIVRRAGEYAFVRPGREMLWSPLDKETKYKAKNTVDVPVYRGADYVDRARPGRHLRQPASRPSSIMVIGAGVAALWAMVGWWLGRRFEGGTTARQQSAPRPSRQPT